MNESSQPIEILLSVARGGGRTLGAQIEDQLRARDPRRLAQEGTQVPSTRDLARQLGVSRRVVVDAYAQLAAEGYLILRQGARPRVSDNAAVARAAAAQVVTARRPARASTSARAAPTSRPSRGRRGSARCAPRSRA